MASVMMILDGMQDVTYESLGGKTPYDAGKGDNFKFIEENSATGRLQTTPDGFEADTQTCVLTLLGVPVEQIPSGRSYLEARAIGMPVGENDIIMRCNFVKISDDGRMEDPTCSVPQDIAEALMAEVAALEGNVVRQVGSYKCLQCISGAGEYLDGLTTYPPHNHAGEALKDLLPRGNALADKLAAFTMKTLEKYKPYTVFNWAVSIPDKMPAFSDLHSGLTGGMVSATHSPMGSAVAMEMQCPQLDGATGDTDTNLASKVDAVLSLMESCDTVILHVGGPDEATHRKDEVEKAEFIAKMDKELIGRIIEAIPDGTRVMVTCDHVAVCTTGGHTEEPVEYMLFEKGRTLSGDKGFDQGIKAIDIMNKKL